jgi:pyruvate formate lyase activating enzyme
MRIGGFVPLSLCDYPGHVAAVVFTQGCNLRCPFCHNGHLIPPAPPAGGLMDGDAVMALLAQRRTRLQGVVITGGEPSMQRGLRAFLMRVRQLGLKTKLDTNGTAPEVIAALLAEGLVDFLAMDIKAPWHKYDRLCGAGCDTDALRRSVALIAASGVAHQFRTTRYHALLDEADYAAIRRQVPAESAHVWQEYRAPEAL